MEYCNDDIEDAIFLSFAKNDRALLARFFTRKNGIVHAFIQKRLHKFISELTPFSRVLLYHFRAYYNSVAVNHSMKLHINNSNNNSDRNRIIKYKDIEILHRFPHLLSINDCGQRRIIYLTLLLIISCISPNEAQHDLFEILNHYLINHEELLLEFAKKKENPNDDIIKRILIYMIMYTRFRIEISIKAGFHKFILFDGDTDDLKMRCYEFIYDLSRFFASQVIGNSCLNVNYANYANYANYTNDANYTKNMKDDYNMILDLKGILTHDSLMRIEKIYYRYYERYKGDCAKMSEGVLTAFEVISQQVIKSPNRVSKGDESRIMDDRFEYCYNQNIACEEILFAFLLYALCHLENVDQYFIKHEIDEVIKVCWNNYSA